MLLVDPGMLEETGEQQIEGTLHSNGGYIVVVDPRIRHGGCLSA